MIAILHRGLRPFCLLALAAGTLLTAAAAFTTAAAAPADFPPDPAKVSWFPTTLSGGPVYALAVGPVAKGRQTVAAGGNSVFVSEQAVSWQKMPNAPGPVESIVAGGDGAFFAAQLNGRVSFSPNGGKNWTPLSVRGQDPVRVVAVSPIFSRDNIAFAITLTDWRLFRTDNTGSKWTPVEIVAEAGGILQVGALAFSPYYARDETLWAGTNDGIYKSTNSGLQWHRISTAGGTTPVFGASAGRAVRQGLIVPADFGDDPERQHDIDDHSMFAYTMAGAYRSDDAGVTWRRLPLDVPEVRDLAVSNGWPADPVLMAAVKAPGAVGAVSSDGGDTWTMVAGRDGLAGTAVAMAVDFAPIPRADRIYVHTILLPLITDRAPIAVPPVPRPPYRGTREAYLATDGDGVWQTYNAGATWYGTSPLHTGAQVSALAFLPGGPDAPVLAGTENAGLYRSPDGGRRWKWLDTGLPRGADQVVNAIRVSPEFGRDKTAYLAATSGVWVSRDGGIGWARTNGPAPAKTLALSPNFTADRTLIAAGQISTDGGATWNALPISDTWSAAAFSPQYATDQTLWAALAGPPPNSQSSQLVRTTDGGQVWETVKGSNLNGRTIFNMAVLQMQADPVKIFLCTENGFLSSLDGGTKWTRPSTGSLGRNTRDVAFQEVSEPAVQAVVLATGEDGAMWSIDRGLNWHEDTNARLRMGRSVTISGNGSVLLVASPLTVMRLGLGSARIYLPTGRKGQ